MENEKVTERDLKRLLKATVTNLITVMEDGSALPKDKEIALKLIDQYQIPIDIESVPRKSGIEEPLPFEEMGIN